MIVIGRLSMTTTVKNVNGVLCRPLTQGKSKGLSEAGILLARFLFYGLKWKIQSANPLMVPGSLGPSTHSNYLLLVIFFLNLKIKKISTYYQWSIFLA